MASEEEKMQGILETVDQQEMVGICGRNDEFLRLIRSAFDLSLIHISEPTRLRYVSRMPSSA